MWRELFNAAPVKFLKDVGLDVPRSANTAKYTPQILWASKCRFCSTSLQTDSNAVDSCMPALGGSRKNEGVSKSRRPRQTRTGAANKNPARRVARPLRGRLLQSSPQLAREFAAAFRARRQRRAIPSPAEGLHQRDCIHHAPAKNINRGDFVRESGGLRRCHLQIAGDSAGIACVRELEIPLRGNDRFVLHLRFVLENSQCSHVVFHLLETRQHDFAIIGDGLIVCSDGLIGGSPAPSR